MCFQESASKIPLIDFSSDAPLRDTVCIKAGSQNTNTGTKLNNMTKTAGFFLLLFDCVSVLLPTFFCSVSPMSLTEIHAAFLPTLV